MSDTPKTAADEVQQILSEMDALRDRLAALDGAGLAADITVSQDAIPDGAEEFMSPHQVEHAVRKELGKAIRPINDAIKPLRSAVNRIEDTVKAGDKVFNTLSDVLETSGDMIKTSGQVFKGFQGFSETVVKQMGERSSFGAAASMGLVSHGAEAIHHFWRLQMSPAHAFQQSVGAAEALADKGLAMDAKRGASIKVEIKEVTADLKDAGEAVMDAIATHLPAFKAPNGSAAAPERAAYAELVRNVDTGLQVMDALPDSVLSPLAVAVPWQEGRKRFALVVLAVNALRDAAEALKTAGAPAPGFAESPAGVPAGAMEGPSDAEISVKSILYGLGLIGTSVTGFLDWLVATVPLSIGFGGSAGVAVAVKGDLGLSLDIVSVTGLLLGSTSALLGWLIAAMQAFPLDLIFG